MTTDENSSAAFTEDAKKQIRLEAIYLVVLGLVALILTGVLWWTPGLLGLNIPDTTIAEQLESLGVEVPAAAVSDNLRVPRQEEFRHYSLAFLAGIIGGTAFAMKWLHHSVGQGPYNAQTNEKGWLAKRFLWRMLVPLLSGAIAFAFYAMLDSQLLAVDITTNNRPAFAFSSGFLVGYFSDRAAAKLSDVAYALFGDARESPGQEGGSR